MRATAEADRLLRRAFPYGACVALDSAPPFLSLCYRVVRVRPDAVAEILFVRDDPGGTVQTVSIAELERSVFTGRLELNAGHVRQPRPADAATLTDPFETFIGPQTSDPTRHDPDQFRARMRLHQSWWRTFRLRVPFGAGPQRSSSTEFGNMLCPSDGAAGLNFVSDEAFTAFNAAKALNPRHVKGWDSAHNLLTSQAMCFNLFGHLRHHPRLAAAFFAELLGEPRTAPVDELRIEYSSDAIPDRTSFDAYTWRSGAGDVAIETKLTEALGATQYDWAWYQRTCAAATGRWVTDDTAQLGDRRWAQLWRNHLLAVAEHLRAVGHRCGQRGGGCRHPQPGGGSRWPRLIVVHHPLDGACRLAVDGYRGLLVDADEVRSVDLRQVVETLRLLVRSDPAQQRWVDRLEDRYVRLELSEPLVALTGP